MKNEILQRLQKLNRTLSTKKKRTGRSTRTEALTPIEDADPNVSLVSRFPKKFPENILKDIFRRVQDTTSNGNLLNCALVNKKWSAAALPILSKVSRIQQLPDELLLEILICVIQTPSKLTKDRENSQPFPTPTTDLAHCIKTCNRWARIAQPLLYRDFVLDVNYNRFYPDASYENPFGSYQYHAPPSVCARLRNVKSVASMIHSLTLELHFMENVNMLPRVNVFETLKNLPNLRTVSIRASPLRRDNWISRGQIARLVQALPPNILNLEVDLMGRDIWDRPDGTPSPPSLCKAIGEQLSHLHHLRVRLAKICPEIMCSLPDAADVRDDPLTSASMPPILKSVVLCQFNREFSSSIAMCCQDTAPPLSTTETLQAFQMQVSKGAFPKLQHCVLSELDPLYPTRYWNLAPEVYIKSYNAKLENWTSRTLIVEDSPVKGYEYSQLDRFQTMGRRRSRTDGRKSGHEADIEMEGPAAWKMNGNGASFP